MKYNAYDILGVEKDATDKEIKDAYDNFIKLYDIKEGTKIFEVLNISYKILSDKYTRASHDVCFYYQDDVMHRFEIAESLANEYDYKGAIEICLDISDRYVNYLEPIEKIGEYLVESFQINKAIDVYENLFKLGYNIEEVGMNLAECLIVRGEDDDLLELESVYISLYFIDYSMIKFIISGLDRLRNKKKFKYVENFCLLMKETFDLEESDEIVVEILLTKVYFMQRDFQKVENLEVFKSNNQTDIFAKQVCLLFYEFFESNEVEKFDVLEEISTSINISGVFIEIFILVFPVMKQILKVKDEFNVNEGILGMIKKYILFFKNNDVSTKLFSEMYEEKFKGKFFKYMNGNLDECKKEIFYIKNNMTKFYEYFKICFDYMESCILERENVLKNIKDIEAEGLIDKEGANLLREFYKYYTDEVDYEEIEAKRQIYSLKSRISNKKVEEFVNIIKVKYSIVYISYKSEFDNIILNYLNSHEEGKSI